MPAIPGGCRPWPGPSGWIEVAAQQVTRYIDAVSTMTAESFAGVWERTIRPGQADLPPEAARYFLKLQFAESDRARMNALAAKARAGALAQEEEAEMANYMQLGWFIDLIKSKARLSLGLSAEKT